MTGSGFRLVVDNRSVEIASRLADDLFAEFGAQRLRFDFLHRAIGQLAQLERPEGNADQPVHLQPERFQHLAHLAVLALADGKGEPDIAALLAIEARLDRPVAHAVDGHA